MNESAPSSGMAQAASYGQQGQKFTENEGQSYGQAQNYNQGQGFSQDQNFNQGQNVNQGQNFEQSGNQTMNSGHQSQTYGEGQNNNSSMMNHNSQNGASNQSYYNSSQQPPNEMTNAAQGHQSGNNYANQQQQQFNNNAQTSGMNGQAGQTGAQYPDSKAPDTMHIWLDKIEKKFGGERFDETKHPENAAKNKALNENIIKKLTQVMKIVMQRGPQMAMQYGSKLF